MKNSNMELCVCPLLERLFKEYDQSFSPLSPKKQNVFRKIASDKGVPDSVIQELCSFYAITYGNPSLDGFWISRWDDVLFEWWEPDRELWLGGRDDDVYRWKSGKYCVGDPSNSSFGKEYEFATLVDMLVKVLTEMTDADA